MAHHRVVNVLLVLQFFGRVVLLQGRRHDRVIEIIVLGHLLVLSCISLVMLLLGQLLLLLDVHVAVGILGRRRRLRTQHATIVSDLVSLAVILLDRFLIRIVVVVAVLFVHRSATVRVVLQLLLELLLSSGDLRFLASLRLELLCLLLAFLVFCS